MQSAVLADSPFSASAIPCDTHLCLWHPRCSNFEKKFHSKISCLKEGMKSKKIILKMTLVIKRESIDMNI